MDTQASEEVIGSYESRNDLALRSAVSDPAAEPRSSPTDSQGPKPSHAKKHSKIESRTAHSQSQPNISGPKSLHAQDIPLNGPKAVLVQLQSKGSSISQSLPENAAPSKGTADQAMTTSLPDFIRKRNELFDKLKRQRHAEILEKEKSEISVVLDLGLDKQGKPRPALPVAAKAWESTPGSFLRHVDRDVSSDVVVAKVDGKELWDLDRPLEYGCRVSYVPFSSAEGRNVFWHSSAHVLGEACECQFNCLLSHGPPVEQGFFYDMAITGG